MKIFYTILISTLFGIGTQAQNFSLTFEDTNVINQVFYTDSILDPQGIWQIGVPNKPLFNSAYSQPNAIVTVLDSAMQPGSKASFIISISSQFNYFPGGSMITFLNKIDFDSAHGGAYVEFSIDSGMHWHGVLMPYANGGYYTVDGQQGFCFTNCGPILIDSENVIGVPMWWHNLPHDTTSTGINYYTGSDSTWSQDTIILPTGCIIKTEPLNPLMLKFTVFADSFSQSKAGWMIDNVNYYSQPFTCLGGINEINSAHLHVYPDPATDEFFVSLLNEPESDYEFILYDLSGRVVIRTRFTGQEITMRRDGIDAGSYFIQLIDQRTQNTFQKRIVFE